MSAIDSPSSLPGRPRCGIAVIAALLLATLLGVLPCRADLGDGTPMGVSTLLDSGDPAARIDIVFLGDGFTAAEQGTFNALVDRAVAEFLGAHPFEALRCAFNIHRVNVASRESGTDVPATCNGSPSGHSAQTRATAMNTTYCAGSVFRCVGSTDSTLVAHYAGMAPGADFIVVLVNDSGHGGCRFGTTTFSTVEDSFEEVVIHELGHALADLADEYAYDGPPTFTGSDSRANITKIGSDRAGLKWMDLVLPGTALPTQPHGSCDTREPAASPVAGDVVGTFEGASYSACGIFRPQHDCRMRVSNQPFCAVCRRALIQAILPSLCRPLGVFFDDLLVRDDQDGFLRGEGEIYLNSTVRSNSESVSTRWPADGESDFDDDDSKTINAFAGSVPTPAPGSTGSIAVQVRESDWPDGDDTLADDASVTFTGPGPFTIDRSDYRLRGQVLPADLAVLFDTLHIDDDHDGVFAGEGDIYVEYTVSNGAQTVSGRWPAGGTRGMDDGATTQIGILAAALPAPTGGANLTIRVRVLDEDSFLTGGDDLIGDDTFTFTAADGFGAAGIVHVEDRSGYRITLSIVGPRSRR
jgi:IgA peptidase M64